jgi:hypothetical protein
MPDSLIRSGQLYFVGYAFDEKLDVWWRPLRGEFSNGKQWEAQISFSDDDSFPQDVVRLIFRALSDPSVQVRFRLESGQTLACAIRSIERLENGSITISSPDLAESSL